MLARIFHAITKEELVQSRFLFFMKSCICKKLPVAGSVGEGVSNTFAVVLHKINQ